MKSILGFYVEFLSDPAKSVRDANSRIAFLQLYGNIYIMNIYWCVTNVNNL